jgi:hypothetical protein
MYGTSKSTNIALKQMVLHNAIRLSEPDTGGEGTGGVYGTLSPSDMHRALGYFHAACPFTETSVFLDLGSGIGKPLMYALPWFMHGIRRGTAPCDTSMPLHLYGVEFDPTKVQKSADFLTSAKHELAKEGFHLSGCNQPKIICAGVEELDSIEPASHVFTAWQGFNDEDKTSVGRLFAKSTTAKGLMIVQYAVKKRDPRDTQSLARVLVDHYEFPPILQIGGPVSVKMKGQAGISVHWFSKTESPHPTCIMALPSDLVTLVELPALDVETGASRKGDIHVIFYVRGRENVAKTHCDLARLEAARTTTNQRAYKAFMSKANEHVLIAENAAFLAGKRASEAKCEGGAELTCLASVQRAKAYAITAREHVDRASLAKRMI